MLILSKGSLYKTSQSEYNSWLNSRSRGSDVPPPGRSWVLLHDNLTPEQAYVVLEEIKKELKQSE